MLDIDDIFINFLKQKFFFIDFLQLFFSEFLENYKVVEESITLEDEQEILQSVDEKKPAVIYRVNLGNKEVFFLVILEHRVSEAYFIPIVILRYMKAIWDYYIEEHKEESEREDFKLPQVIPVVYYDGLGKWPEYKSFFEITSIASGYEEYTLNFSFKLIDESKLDRKELLNSNTLAGLFLYAYSVDHEILRKEDNNDYEKYLHDFLKIKRCNVLRMFKMMLDHMEKSGVGVDDSEFAMIKEKVEEMKNEGCSELETPEKELKETRELILKVLEERFGEIPNDLADMIEKIPYGLILNKLLFYSLLIPDIDKYRKLLEELSKEL